MILLGFQPPEPCKNEFPLLGAPVWGTCYAAADVSTVTERDILLPQTLLAAAHAHGSEHSARTDDSTSRKPGHHAEAASRSTHMLSNTKVPAGLHLHVQKMVGHLNLPCNTAKWGHWARGLPKHLNASLASLLFTGHGRRHSHIFLSSSVLICGTGVMISAVIK